MAAPANHPPPLAEASAAHAVSASPLCSPSSSSSPPSPLAFSTPSTDPAALNVSGAGQLVATLIDLNVTARNPNKKLVFLYDQISVSVVLVSGSGGVNVGDGSHPGFVQEARSTKVLSTPVASGGRQLDLTATAYLKKSSSFGANVEMRTKAGVKIGKLKTKKMEIKVLCDGINFAVSKGKGGDCKVKLSIKIWKWNL